MHAQRIERLLVHHFRNLGELELEPGRHFNVVHGDNGAGKSNLLEAVYYLGALRSFRSAKAADMVTLREARPAMLEARVLEDAIPRRFRVRLPRSQARRLTLDGKRPRSIATWHAALPMVLFHPGQLRLSTGPAEARRAFLDRVLEQMDPTYAAALGSYQKALRSRNRLLKKEPGNRRAIRAFDPLIASAGTVVGQSRDRLVRDLAPRVQCAFGEVVGERPSLQVVYRPRVQPSVTEITRALGRSLARDLARGYTTEGPHGDDLAFELSGLAPVRHHASQGQHRALVLALKVAELEILGRCTGRVPILLLDDVSSELDRGRSRRLFDLLAGLGGQVFLTTTHPEFILLDRDRRDFRVRHGRLEPTRA